MSNNYNTKVCFREKYGPFETGQIYTLISEKHDYFVVKNKGRHICVPKEVVSFNTYKITHPPKEPDEDYQDFLLDDFVLEQYNIM